MAKKRDEFNFDDDLDFDLDKELGGIDFGDDNSKPPKNKREAISQSLKDARRGFKNELFENKLKTAGKLAKNSIPRSLSAEFGEISGLASDVKDIVSDSIGDIKKQTAGLSRALGKLVPENSKIANLLKKVGDKLDDQSTQNQEAAKAEQENNEIQAGILGVLGEMKDKSHADAMIQQAIQNKQFASNIEMLKNIYAETKLQRLFQYEITNAYYRKSLELQYKQLFTQREILEIQKLAFTTHKNQLETIVLNTALPDYLKARGKEALEYTIKQRMRDLVAGNLFKSGSGFDNFSKNVTRKLKGFMSGLKEGLGGTRDMAEMMGDMSSMYKEMGMKPGEMVGSGLANFFNQYIGGKIGKQIEKTKWGKEGIFNIKEAVADPRKFFKSVANKKDAKGIHKVFSKLAKFGLGFTEDPKILEAKYTQGDLDDSAMFDNRAHQSLTKVIPGLLSRIYAEIKMTRTGLKIKGSSQAHELVFDNKDDTFKTKKQLVNTINREIRTSLKGSFKSTASMLHHALAEMGVGLSGGEASGLNRALLNYSMQPGSSVAAGTLYDPDFLKFIQDPKLADKMAKNAPKIREYLVNNPNEQEWISGMLSSLKTNLPNLNKRFEDLHKSGHTDVLMGMKVAKRSKYTGALVSNTKGVKNQIMRNYTDDLSDADIPPWLIGASSSIVGQLVGNKIDNAASAAKNYLSNVTAEDVINGTVNAAAMAGDYAKAGLNKVQQAANYVDNKFDVSGKASDLQKRFMKTKAGKMTKKLADQAKKKANKLKRTVKKNKTVQSILKSKSVKTVTGFLVDGANKVEDFFGRPKEEISADLVKAYNETKKAATDFINKASETAKAVRNDSDVQVLENVTTDTMKEIAAMTKKVLNGEATKEDLDNFKANMKARGKQVKDAGVSLGNRSKPHLQNTAERAKDYGTKAKGKVEELADKVQGTNAWKTVAGKASASWDKATEYAQQARDATRDPKAMVDFAKTTFGKIKNLFKKAVEESEAQEMYSRWKAECRKKKIDTEGVTFADFCRDFDIKVKTGPGGIKGFFQATRRLDRAIWTSVMGGALKFPFKFMGGMLGNTRIGHAIGKIPVVGKWTGLDGSGFSAGAGNITAQAGGMMATGAMKTMNAALDMLPMGMGEVVKAPFHFMGTAVGIMGQMMSLIGLKTKKEEAEAKKKAKEEKKKEQKEKEKNSSDGWMSRLKFWGKRKKNGEEEGDKKKSLLDRLKENKTPLTIMGALVGIWGFTKMIGISIQDVIGGISKVVTTVVKIGKGIYDLFGGGLTGIMGLLGSYFAMKGLGKLALRKLGGYLGGKAAGLLAGAGSWVKNKVTGGPKINPKTPSIDSKGRYRTPDGKFAKNPNAPAKAPKPKTPSVPKVDKAAGTGLWNKFSSGIKFMLSPWKEKIVNILAKLSSMWKTITSKLSWIGKVITKPKVAVKVGAKAAAKVTSYIASAATGIGAIVTLGFAVWDTAWILKYMVIDGLSFWSALSKQMLGVDLFNKDVQKELDISEADREKEFTETEIKEKQKQEEEKQKQDDSLWGKIKTGAGKLAGAVDTALSMTPGVGHIYQGAKKILGIGPEIDSTTQARKAASMAEHNASSEFLAKGNGKYAELGPKDPKKSIGRCATYVNKSLRDAGYNFAGGDGWQVGPNLGQIGWQRVAFDPDKPNSFKPQKGDVVSFARVPNGAISEGNSKYGHAAIFNGTKWVSDFIQNKMSPYTRDSNKEKLSYHYATVWRDPANTEAAANTAGSAEQGSGDISAFDRAKYSRRIPSFKQRVSTRVSGNDNSSSIVNVDTRSVTDVLQQSLQVHIESRDLLKEIRDVMAASVQVQTQTAAQSPSNNVMPESVIRLTHNSYN